MSLRRRFVLVLALFSLGMAVMLGALTWRISSDALQAELERRLLWAAGTAGVAGFDGEFLLTLEPGFEDEIGWTGNRQRLARMREYVADAFIFDARANTMIVGADSTLRIGAPVLGLDSYRPEINRALATGEATTPVFDHPVTGAPYKYGFKQLDGTPAILAVLIPADFYAPLGRLANWLLWGSAVGVLLAVAVGGVLAAGIAAPLERLSRVALRIQRGRMSKPVDVQREDEIGRLSRAMERMRQGILERDEQLRLMLAQVAHEIRNPLGGLELFASAAAETDDPVERRRLMDRVRGEVTALNRIIDDFLAYARPTEERGRVTDVREPVTDAAELAEPELVARGGRLQVDLGDEPQVIVADPAQVKRVVLNLLRNAAQAGDRVLLETFRKGSEVVVSVTDDGPGVPPELRARIFEPFVTDKEKGAGLGLAIVKKVLDSLGGRCEVADPEPDSGFETGARFLLYFVGVEEPPPPRRDPGVGGVAEAPATRLSAQVP